MCFSKHHWTKLKLRHWLSWFPTHERADSRGTLLLFWQVTINKWWVKNLLYCKSPFLARWRTNWDFGWKGVGKKDFTHCSHKPIQGGSSGGVVAVKTGRRLVVVPRLYRAAKKNSTLRIPHTNGLGFLKKKKTEKERFCFCSGVICYDLPEELKQTVSPEKNHRELQVSSCKLSYPTKTNKTIATREMWKGPHADENCMAYVTVLEHFNDKYITGWWKIDKVLSTLTNTGPEVPRSPRDWRSNWPRRLFQSWVHERTPQTPLFVCVSRASCTELCYIHFLLFLLFFWELHSGSQAKVRLFWRFYILDYDAAVLA